MQHVIGVILFSIFASVVIANAIVVASKYYNRREINRMGVPKPYACARVHLGPVIEGNVGGTRWQKCCAEGCGKLLNETEQTAYWRTKRAALKVKHEALLGARTK